MALATLLMLAIGDLPKQSAGRRLAPTDASVVSHVEAGLCLHAGVPARGLAERDRGGAQGDKDAKLAQKLGQLQPFIAVLIIIVNARANLHILGQPETCLALGLHHELDRSGRPGGHGRGPHLGYQEGMAPNL